MRGGALQELRTDPAIDTHSEGGLTLALIHHAKSGLTARDLLDRYRKTGPTAIEQRGDDCAVVLVDETTRTVILARDFAGVIPLYYAAKDDRFAFASSISAVFEALALTPTPDPAALASLLVDHHGRFPTQTWFEDVAVVEPGTMLVSRAGDMTICRIEELRPAKAWHFDDAVAEFAHLLEQAVARRTATSGATAVFVSGGLDSSSLLCLAAKSGEVIGINYGVHDDAAADESRYVEALRRIGLRVDEVPFLPAIDVASLEHSVRTSEAPLFDTVALTLARAAAHGVHGGAQALLIGTWGDQVLSPFPPAHHRSVAPWRVSALARAYHGYMTDVPVAEIRAALRRQALRQHAPEWLLQLRRARARRNSTFDVLAQRVAWFGPAERTRSYRDAVVRGVFGASGQQGIEMTSKWGSAQGITAHLPFLDRELVQFLLSIPDEIAYHRHALKPLLRAGMKGIVPEAIRERRDKGDYTSVMRRSGLPRTTILDLLDGLRRLVHFDIMSPAAARKTLARIESKSDIGGGTDVWAVLGLDVWLRLFIEK